MAARHLGRSPAESAAFAQADLVNLDFVGRAIWLSRAREA